ncbi:helix-turn-helix domain-containing protein [Burkholderia vietnamiensis]|uniref:helix-turn-helix domain-containing protein n=1 Tax=Burkholderia vietnamiensis TaxID=60552 RepID=UPI001B9DD2C2|nr:helix-turn-helix domain-containing protein [Burkholderia vietnamiensis]MBR8049546.1 helix-turn-helix domain-containing protein [Burkholderia vietnamiensis]
MKTVSPFYSWRRAMMSSALPSTTKLVLFVVAEYSNGMDGTCWPSLETIAEKATLSIRAVTKHLGIAVKFGWLTSWRSRRPDRKWAHAHYRLSIPEDVALQQRDAIDLDLAAADDELAVGEPERGAGSAQTVGKSAPRASKSGESLARGASNSAAAPERGGSEDTHGPESNDPVESSWHHVPTNYPVNRNMSKPSLYQTTVVSTGSGEQREKPCDEDFSFARWMLDKLRADDPGFPAPSLEKWEADVAAMIRDDGRSVDAMAKLVGYAMRDKFWKRVITSPARLRKNWDELRRRRNAALESKATASAPGAVERHGSSGVGDRQCAHVETGCRCTNSATTLIGAGASRRGYCRKHIGFYEE